MRGSTLVNAVREDTSKYPNVCRMNLCLYDGKDRQDLGEDAVYVEDLFANNANERIQFIKALDGLEKETPSSLNVKITEAHVILFYKDEHSIPKRYSRKSLPEYD